MLINDLMTVFFTLCVKGDKNGLICEPKTVSNACLRLAEWSHWKFLGQYLTYYTLYLAGCLHRFTTSLIEGVGRLEFISSLLVLWLLMSFNPLTLPFQLFKVLGLIKVLNCWMHQLQWWNVHRKGLKLKVTFS